MSFLEIYRGKINNLLEYVEKNEKLRDFVTTLEPMLFKKNDDIKITIRTGYKMVSNGKVFSSLLNSYLDAPILKTSEDNNEISIMFYDGKKFVTAINLAFIGNIQIDNVRLGSYKKCYQIYFTYHFAEIDIDYYIEIKYL